MAANPISVMIVEDNTATRRGLQLFIQAMPGINVVSTLESADNALETALELRPDLVLMDISMPGKDGISGAKELKHECPDLPVLMLTASEDTDAIFAAFAAGADGYVLKSSFSSSLEHAIRAVQRGSVWLDPQIAQEILKLANESNRSLGRLSKALSKTDRATLEDIAEAGCSDGVCLVKPEFLERIRRFQPHNTNTSEANMR